MPFDPQLESRSAPGLGPGDLVREQDKIMLLFAYLGPFALIPLLTVKDSDYVRWHARQGVVFMLSWIAYWIVSGVVSGIGFWLGPLGPIIWGITALGHLGMLAIWIVALIKAFEPSRWRIPIIGIFADRL